MRHRGALSIITGAITTLALALSTGAAHAQVVYDDQDWTIDRGSVNIGEVNGAGGVYFPQQALRQGFNNFVGTLFAYPNGSAPANRTNDPDHARRRWVWPASIDLNAFNGNASAYTVDNPFPASLLPPPPPVLPGQNGLLNKAALSNGQQADDALSYWNPNGFNTWAIPDPTLRVFQGGFSYGFDPTLNYDFDYGVVAPTQGTFQYTDVNGTQTATVPLLEELPYVPPSLYRSVHNALVAANNGNAITPTAVWSIGSVVTVSTVTATTQVPVAVGNYGVDIYSPGDGTQTADGVIHPNLTHVFVRVSWGQGAVVAPNPAQPEVVTVNYNKGNPTASTINFGTGGAGGGGINDPLYSRIYMVDMSGSPGWHHIAANGSSSTVIPLQPAAFPFDGNPKHQIVVTLFSITPDNLSDTNLYGNPPLVTADAVRFVPLTTPKVPITVPATDPVKYFQAQPLAYMSPTGSILAPAAGTNKIATGTLNDAGDPAAPVNGNAIGQALYYVARNELMPNPYFNPLPVLNPAPIPPAPVDPTNPLTPLTAINDLSSVLSVPVFYCLDNVKEDNPEPNPVAGTTPIQRYSKRRVRWRYVATPDQQLTPFDMLNGQMGDLGNSASIASPLLATVRCRDGKIRNMVFFVTTNNDGSLGHVYALDPLGNNPFDGFAAKAIDPGDLTTRTTTAYWVYPSVRPLMSGLALNNIVVPANLPEPRNAPAQWNDPNFTIPANLISGYQREIGAGSFLYPLPTFGADQTDNNGTQVYDGDIIGSGPNGAPTDPNQPYITQGNTLLTMPGMAWAPTLVDDPENLNGPQILVVGGKSYDTATSQIGGRLYALDAGGRGDFGPITDNTNKVLFNASGTTQRLWTWPHFGADAFHRVAKSDPVKGFYLDPAKVIQDESAKGYFSGSPVFDTHYPTLPADPGYKPLIVGSADGHVYAVLPFHDHFQGVTNGVAYYDDSRRSQWVYPDPNTDGGVGLGNAISTPAVLHTGTGSYLYFTCDGFYGVNARVYAIPEAPIPGQPTNSGPIVNKLYWVYPFVANPPIQNTNNANDLPALFPGFGGTAPVAVNASTVNFAGQTAGLQLTQDTVYVVQNDGTLTGLVADPGAGGKGTTAVYSQNPPVTGTTSITPMLSLVEPLTQDGLFSFNFTGDPTLTQNTYISNFPSILFGDDFGGIYGFGVTSIFDGTGTATGTSNQGGVGTVLPLDWGYPGGSDPTFARYAPVTLTSGFDPNLNVDGTEHLGTPGDPNLNPVRDGNLLEGDANGQLYAYSVGSGSGGVGETVGTGEFQNQDQSGIVDVDLRVVNFYQDHDVQGARQSDWEDFMLPNVNAVFQGGQPETPAEFFDGNGNSHGPLGAGFPAPATLGKAVDPSDGVAVDWGGEVYVSAWGVYHAQPMQADMLAYSPTSKIYGLAPPTITVTFNIQQPGGSTTRQVTVPAVIPQNNGVLFPGDLGYGTTANPGRFGGNYGLLSIWGFYVDAKGNPQIGLITGSSTRGAPIAYPWVAKTKFTILPDQRHPYSPGVAGVRVWAQASAAQTVAFPVKGVEQPLRLTYNSPRLFAGQNDKAGKQTGSGFQTSPNDVAALGKPRPLYISNALGLTVRGFNNVNDMTGGNPPNIIGWGGAIDTPNGLADPREVLGNHTSIGLDTNSLQKSLFAPIDMLDPGSTGTYMGLDPASGQRVAALYVLDRSNYYKASGNKRLQVSVSVPALTWHGGTTSVMNPLPWEQMPDDQHDTIDYPAIPSNNLSITTADGTDITRTPDYLAPPTYPTANDYDRIPTPTPLILTLKIPQYQPANVNRGPITIKDPLTGQNHTFGSSFLDDAGNTVSEILGPINNTTGNTPGAAASGRFPAGGYIARGIQVTINLPGQNFFPPRPFNGFGIAGQQAPTRQFIAGTAVSPQFKMSVQEQTVDFGKLPAGTGYTDPDLNNKLFFRVPFAPTGTGPYQSSSGTPVVNSPWDDPTQLGQYFRPFTVISTGNVNYVDLRINKLYGQLGATISGDSWTTNPDAGTAVGLRLLSNEVSDLLEPQLLGAPFGITGSNNAAAPWQAGMLGNIGIVSSLDHYSDNSPQNPNQANTAYNNTSEFTLYPIANPALDANALTQAQTLFNLGLTLDANWGSAANPVQPRPTLHKPRPGDGTGSTLTIPDAPHDLNAGNFGNNLFQPRSPEIGIAVPIGTPAGTYTGTVIPYEDHLPIQWTEWLTSSRAAGSSNLIGSTLGQEDGVFNVNASGQPVEPYADPGINVRLNVRENRITGGTFAGSLSQIDLLNPLTNAGSDLRNTPTAYGGANMQPAPIQFMTSLINSNIQLYWPTNRQPDNNGGFVRPEPNQPWSIALTSLLLPYGNFFDQKNSTLFVRTDAEFAKPGNGSYVAGPMVNPLLVDQQQLWSPPTLLNFDDISLFQNPGNEPVGTTPIPTTVKFGSPATTQATNIVGNDLVYSFNTFDNEAYLTYMGQVDKQEPLSTASANGSGSVTESRLFWSLLDNFNNPGAQPKAVNSMFNDPQLPKYGPHPLLVKIAPDNTRKTPDSKLLYLFWASGPQARTALYYNVNAYHLSGNGSVLNSRNDAITPYGWGTGGLNGNPINPNDPNELRLGDQPLSTPNSLVWQSDPYPVFRRVIARNPFVSNPSDPAYGNQVFDAIDVYYTGVLKDKQTVEILMTRYGIYRGEHYGPGLTAVPGVKIGQLFPLELTQLVNETTARVGTSHTYRTRDIAWYTGSPAEPGQIVIALQRTVNGSVQTYNLNYDPANPGTVQKGRFDPASGLIYYEPVSTDGNGNIVTGANGRPLFGGGKLVVDARSGTISFPDVAPLDTDTILATYRPQMMRMNTSRDGSNVVNLAGSSFNGSEAIFQPLPLVEATGNNSAPTVIMDRTPNPRTSLIAPKVVFNLNGNVMNTNRLWVLYRKSDLSGGQKSTIYLKAMRLMARLPYPMALTQPNNQGQQQIVNVGVKVDPADPFPGVALGPWEADWVRGRVYFSEQDQGRLVDITYNYINANGQSVNSGTLVYQVAWGDEMSQIGKSPDETTQEVPLPMDAAVNEGQVAAFKDQIMDKLWVFWSSNRAGTTDLYYETIAPQLYPQATNQR